ncbi:MULTISPECIES: transporter substrate-binding domain-containing protein [Roseobacteraceae]|uniref:Cystine transporter subunit n=1 Tax=Pseudosulfitobacter pseudonitzschiae TaxID=1402135 RepID=A0A221K7N1_9RHOB|nr:MULTISPECIES: transporter substrate-binding domain-containing protein [Roseobacteraceae]ASM75011.1 cystine transporter subunit [Pseudosulfitobacter pseudonitzschiae]
MTRISILARLGAAVTAAALMLGANQAAAQDSTWDQIKESGKIRLGCSNSEPWYFKDPGTGEWSGIGPGFTALLAEELGVEWECVETTWGNAVAGLQANQFDMMVALDATPQRALAVDFPQGALLYYAVAVLARKDLDASEWSKLNTPDIRVAVPLGTSNDAAISKELPQATFERTKGNPEAIASFAAGRSDLVGGASLWLAMQNRALNNAGQVVIPSPASAAATSIGIRLEDDKRWRDWLSIAINHYYHRGQTQKVYEDFLASRGVDPKDAPPIRIEDMN